jgi:hypothetical protein
MQKINIMLSAVDRNLDSRRRSTVKVVTVGIVVGDGNDTCKN